MIDDTNVVLDYHRHYTRDICKTVRTLSDEDKQQLLDQIQLQKGVHNLREQEYDQQTCKYIESLLNGKRPKNGLTK